MYLMEYYIKKLCHQELGSVSSDGKVNRGRYMFSSKDIRVLKMFPPLSQTQKNDSALLAMIPLYLNKKVYCNYVYHNDKYHGGSRNEYRIYLNSELENNQILFKKDDIVIIRKDELIAENENEEYSQTVYFLELIQQHDSKLYKLCENEITNSGIRGNFAIYNGEIREFEQKVNKLKSNDMVNVAIDNSVVKQITKEENADKGLDDKIADLFNASSFRDFVMVGYSNICAVTGNVITWNSYNNLEAAHIKPKSHGGLYTPNNGIAMSRDIHWAFDKGFFTISDDFKIIVHDEIDSEYLKSFNGKQIRLPENSFFVPDKSNLSYHRENVFGLFKTTGRL